jgi:hypothetical protein
MPIRTISEITCSICSGPGAVVLKPFPTKHTNADTRPNTYAEVLEYLFSFGLELCEPHAKQIAEMIKGKR